MKYSELLMISPESIFTSFEDMYNYVMEREEANYEDIPSCKEAISALEPLILHILPPQSMSPATPLSVINDWWRVSATRIQLMIRVWRKERGYEWPLEIAASSFSNALVLERVAPQETINKQFVEQEILIYKDVIKFATMTLEEIEKLKCIKSDLENEVNKAQNIVIRSIHKLIEIQKFTLSFRHVSGLSLATILVDTFGVDNTSVYFSAILGKWFFFSSQDRFLRLNRIREFVRVELENLRNLNDDARLLVQNLVLNTVWFAGAEAEKREGLIDAEGGPRNIYKEMTQQYWREDWRSLHKRALELQFKILERIYLTMRFEEEVCRYIRECGNEPSQEWLTPVFHKYFPRATEEGEVLYSVHEYVKDNLIE